MTEKYLLGIDAGTSLIKSIIFNLASQELDSRSQKVEIDSPRTTWMQQDMHAVWATTAATIKQAIASTGINAEVHEKFFRRLTHSI